MSLDPQPVFEAPPASAAGDRPTPRRHPLLTACYSLLALATGLTLAIAPWADNWNFNYLQSLDPTLEYLWDEALFRGALTALGILNIFIAIREMVGLLRAGERRGN
jgi:hypothetical protein